MAYANYGIRRAQVYQQLQEQPWSPLLEGFYQEWLQTAVRYAHIQTEWSLANQKERAGMERERRIAHDRFIDACNILSRNMAIADLDASWRKRLGQNRKVIGDLACYVHCFLGLSAR